MTVCQFYSFLTSFKKCFSLKASAAALAGTWTQHNNHIFHTFNHYALCMSILYSCFCLHFHVVILFASSFISFSTNIIYYFPSLFILFIGYFFFSISLMLYLFYPFLSPETSFIKYSRWLLSLHRIYLLSKLLSMLYFIILNSNSLSKDSLLSKQALQRITWQAEWQCIFSFPSLLWFK